MPREIKFRAWDENDKCMSEVKGYDYESNLLWLANRRRNDILGYLDCEFPIMQYTGLKDKDGKEIYEGDIVEINGHFYAISYEIGSFMLVRCSLETDMYSQFDNCWNDDVYPLSQFYWENDCEEDTIYQCEVISDIYENPELLEG